MIIRDATEADLADVASIAHNALRSAYEDLLQPETLNKYLSANYTSQALDNRLADHPIFVVEIDHEVCAFADAFIQDGRIVISEICTRPAWRRQGCGRHLVDEVHEMDESLAISADVLLGNEVGERFYEALLFAPGEIVQMQMFGEQVVERRWWRPPMWTEDVAAGGGTLHGNAAEGAPPRPSRRRPPRRDHPRTR